MELWTALAIGFFGSFHCIGMCGPIALALPGKKRFNLSHLVGRILYNLGRVTTYSLLGLLFGIIGKVVSLAGIQGPLSISLGVIILVSLILPSSYSQKVKNISGLNYIWAFAKNQIGKLFRSDSHSSLYTIGILNGLLPCGFVYMGLAGAITTGTIWYSALYMMLFGFGTVPAMLTISLASNLISLNLRKRINALIPYLAAVLGILFILRGLSLGIPFISPDISQAGHSHMGP